MVMGPGKAVGILGMLHSDICEAVFIIKLLTAVGSDLLTPENAEKHETGTRGR